MSKELTEKYYNCLLDDGFYYAKSNDDNNTFILEVNPWSDKQYHNCNVLAPVPNYRELYGENDGNMPTGVFTILKIIKRDIENAQKRRSLTDLECGIKSQVVSLLKLWGVE